MLTPMTSFQGTMRIQGEVGPPVPVKARIGEDRLVLEVDGVAVGEWPVTGLRAEVDGGGVNLSLGQERVMIDVTDRIGFVSALAPRSPARAVKRRRRPSLPLVGVVLVATAIVAAAVMAPDVVGSVALLAGLVVLVAGAMAHSEPRIALRLPLNLQAIQVVLVGLLFLAVGVFLVVIA